MHSPKRLSRRIHVYDDAVLKPWVIRLSPADVGYGDICCATEPFIE